MLSGDATNINFIVFDLTRSGFEPTIYSTRDEHANLDLTRSGLEPTIYSTRGEHANLDLTRSGLEPTIYCTRGEHANHWSTDAVQNPLMKFQFK